MSSNTTGGNSPLSPGSGDSQSDSGCLARLSPSEPRDSPGPEGKQITHQPGTQLSFASIDSDRVGPLPGQERLTKRKGSVSDLIARFESNSRSTTPERSLTPLSHSALSKQSSLDIQENTSSETEAKVKDTGARPKVPQASSKNKSDKKHSDAVSNTNEANESLISNESVRAAELKGLKEFTQKYLKEQQARNATGLQRPSDGSQDPGDLVEDNLDSDMDLVAFDSSCHKCHCGKTFANKPGLLSHIRQGHRDPETVHHYQCKHCPMKTTNFGSLKAHILAVHPDKVKHFKCDKCFKKYTNKENWAKHKRECHKSENFSHYEKKKKTEDVKCPDCKAILKSNNLSRHQKESCKGRKSKSETTLRMYGKALSKVLKDKDPLSDEDNVLRQKVEDDVYAESQLQVNRTAVETNDIDPTVMDVYFCTNCLKKGLTEKEKKEHMKTHTFSQP